MILSIAFRRLLTVLAVIAIASFSTHVSAMTATGNSPSRSGDAGWSERSSPAAVVSFAQPSHDGDRDTRRHSGTACCGQACNAMIPFQEPEGLGVFVVATRKRPDLGQFVEGIDPDTALRPPR